MQKKIIKKISCYIGHTRKDFIYFVSRCKMHLTENWKSRIVASLLAGEQRQLQFRHLLSSSGHGYNHWPVPGHRLKW